MRPYAVPLALGNGTLTPTLDVVAAALRLAESGKLSANIAISLQRVVGMTIGLSRVAETILAPTIQAVRAIPSLAWVPLFVLSMVLLALFGKGTDTLLQVAERRLLRWRDTYEG